MNISINSNGLCVLIQIILIILKACFVEPFNSYEWNNPIMWIPLLIVAINFCIFMIFLIIKLIIDIK